MPSQTPEVIETRFLPRIIVVPPPQALIDQAIENLLAERNPEFQDFPPEIRLYIYRILFSDARIIVDRTPDQTPGGPPTVSIYRQPDAVGLLASNRIIRHEALPVLQASVSTLHIACGGYHYSKLAIFKIPRQWRARIKTIEYSVHRPQLHLYLADYVNLQNITIGAKLFRIKQQDQPERHNVAARILNKVQTSYNYLVNYGSRWIVNFPHLKVILRVILISRQNGGTIGWEIYIDTAHWVVIDAKKARFTQIPLDAAETAGKQEAEQRRIQNRWNNSAEAWTTELLE